MKIGMDGTGWDIDWAWTGQRGLLRDGRGCDFGIVWARVGLRSGMNVTDDMIRDAKKIKWI
jgi:hypothetical protein